MLKGLELFVLDGMYAAAGIVCPSHCERNCGVHNRHVQGPNNGSTGFVHLVVKQVPHRDVRV